jgi:hypothetical protein
LTWEFRGFEFLLYRWDEAKFDAAKVSACLKIACELVGLIPGYLRKEARA